ncbi:hypothetical protein EPUL_006697, partial [Erysiphe pulchra]
MTTRQLSERQVRWAEELADFDFEIKFRSGIDSSKPDTLSRKEEFKRKNENDERIKKREFKLLKDRWLSPIKSSAILKDCLRLSAVTTRSFKPVLRPIAPEKGDLNDAEYSIKTNEHEVLLASWIEGEIEARNILVNSITKDICPQNFLNMTAKQIFDHVANARGEGATTPWETV